MSGMFEPKDGDFASYIKNFNAKTIEKFSAKSKALLTKQQDSFKAQDPDFSKKADAQFSAEPQHPSLGVTIAVYLFFAVVILGISGVIWGVCYLLFDSGLRTFGYSPLKVGNEDLRSSDRGYSFSVKSTKGETSDDRRV